MIETESNLELPTKRMEDYLQSLSNRFQSMEELQIEFKRRISKLEEVKNQSGENEQNLEITKCVGNVTLVRTIINKDEPTDTLNSIKNNVIIFY
jgi:predicted ATP-dependent serine protease